MSSSDDVLELQVVGLDGTVFPLSVSSSLLGSQLHQLVAEKIPAKPGARVVLLEGDEVLEPKKMLKEQLSASAGCFLLSYVYEAASLYEAWNFIGGNLEDSNALEGIRSLGFKRWG